MSPLLWRASLRSLVIRPVQAGLAVLGVALGVAVAVSINLANASAERAFTLSTETVSGRATDQVEGGPARLPETLFTRLVSAGFTVAPVVEDWVLAPRPGRTPRNLHLIGLDPFSEAPFRSLLSAGAARTAGDLLTPLLTTPGGCLLAASTASDLGVRLGQRFSLRTAAGPVSAQIVGFLGGRGGGGALDDLMVVDIATAQELLGRPGGLDHIDVRLAPEALADRRRLRAILPGGAQLIAAGTRTETALAMTRAFRINLTALSLLALLCGTFLIYNTVSFSVVQRRTLFGILRALGVTRGGVFALVLGEAALLGVTGTLLGLLGGVVLGRGLVGLVTRTINDLYFALTVRTLALPASTLLGGAALGIGATLVAALAPAVEATMTPPRAVLGRSLLEARVRRALPRAAALGALLLGLGGAVLARPQSGLVACFAALFAVTLGFALLTPAAAALLLTAARAPLGALCGPLGRMAAGGVVSALSRSAVAIAALVVAISVTVGMGVMIVSFRATVVRWLDDSLIADLYVAPAYRTSAQRGATLSPDLARRAAAIPGVERVDAMRRSVVVTPRGSVRLLAVGGERSAFAGFELQDTTFPAAWRVLSAGGVLVSEAFAEHTGARPGGVVTLPSRDGPRQLPIGGVFADYGSDQGIVLLRRSTYLRLFGDPALSGFAVTLAPGASQAAVREHLEGVGGPTPLIITSHRDLKRFSLEIFDRTFLITDVLRLLAALVAGLGVLSALAALALERAREFAILRAQGLTPQQLWKLVLGQSTLIGLTSGVLALPVGLTLALIMIRVINRRSFGWSIPFVLPPQVLLQALLLTLVAALLAGIYPAWRTARSRPAEALREE